MVAESHFQHTIATPKTPDARQLTFLMFTRHTLGRRVTFLAHNRDTHDTRCSPTHIFNVHAPHLWSPRCGRLAALNPGVQQSRRYGPSKSPRCGRLAALNPGVQQSRRYGPSMSPRCGRLPARVASKSPRCGRVAALNPGVQQSRRYGPSKSPRCGRLAALIPCVQQSCRSGPSKSYICTNSRLTASADLTGTREVQARREVVRKTRG